MFFGSNFTRTKLISSPLEICYKNNNVTLYSCLLTYKHCHHIVEWVFEGNDKISSDLDVSPRTFSVTLTFTTPHLKLKSRNYELLQYKATDEHTEGVQLFTIPQASGGNTGEKLWLHNYYLKLMCVLTQNIAVKYHTNLSYLLSNM